MLCKHLLKYLEKHEILSVSDLQHGFRSGRSCEMQIITMFHDLAESHSLKKQVDVAILEFSRAFDTDALLSKIKHYSIHEKILI